MTQSAHLVFMTALGVASITSACGEDVTAPDRVTGSGSTGDASGATTAAASASAGAGGAVAGATVATASNASSSSTGGSDPFEINAKKHGTIYAVNGNATAMGKQLHAYVVQAEFDSAPDAMNDICTVTTSGLCLIRTCSSPGSLGTETTVSAGIVEINGGKEVVSLSPDAMGVYPQIVDSMNSLWDGGDTLTISAAGAAVPAFSTMVVAASGCDFTSPPAPVQGQPLLVDRMTDLVFTWANGGAGNVNALFAASSPDVTVQCSFPSAGGTGTVPKSVLSVLPSGSAGAFSLTSGGMTEIFAGEWSVQVFLTATTTWGGAVLAPMSYQATN